MRWIVFAEATGLHTLLVVTVCATLFTTTQSRVAVPISKEENNINNNNNNSNDNGGDREISIEEILSPLSSSSSSASSVSSSPSSMTDDESQYDLEGYITDYDEKDYITLSKDEDDDDDEDYSDEDEDFDLWPVLCPPNTFYSLEKDECMACTPCPTNSFTYKECHRFDDNLCLPITLFHSGENGDPNTDPSAEPGVSDKKTADDDESTEWRSVSLTLLIFTSVMFLCLVTVGSIFFYLRRRARTASTTKEILCSYSPAPNFPIVKVAEV